MSVVRDISYEPMFRSLPFAGGGCDFQELGSNGRQYRYIIPLVMLKKYYWRVGFDVLRTGDLGSAKLPL